MRLNALRHLAMLAFSLLAVAAHAGEIIDVTGRKIELDLPAKRVIVGEARQVHVIAALKGDQTFDTIVGWRDDLVKKDPDSYAAYVERFPEIEKLPRFGYVPQGISASGRPSRFRLLSSHSISKRRNQPKKAVSKKKPKLRVSRSSISIFASIPKRTVKPRSKSSASSSVPKSARRTSSPIAVPKSPV